MKQLFGGSRVHQRRSTFALTPSWACLPESGAGAAKAGGRFNRPNVAARYLAATPQAALTEYQAEATLLPPATVAAYRVMAAAVVGFSAGFDPQRWAPIWFEAYCNWKRLAFLEQVEPPSWVIGDLVRAALDPEDRRTRSQCVAASSSQQCYSFE